MKAATNWLKGTIVAGRDAIGQRDNDSMAARSDGLYAEAILEALESEGTVRLDEEAWAWIRQQTKRGDYPHRCWARQVHWALIDRSDRETVEARPWFEVAS